MAYGRLRNEEPIAIYDRAYRLRSNVTQVSFNFMRRYMLLHNS